MQLYTVNLTTNLSLYTVSLLTKSVIDDGVSVYIKLWVQTAKMIHWSLKLVFYKNVLS